MSAYQCAAARDKVCGFWWKHNVKDEAHFQPTITNVDGAEHPFLNPAHYERLGWITVLEVVQPEEKSPGP